nr:hypothetical protein [Nitrosomonas nitrosa]
MNTGYYDPLFLDERCRQELHQGQLLVYSPKKSTLVFIEFARTLIKEAFHSYDPEIAQRHLSIEQYADLLSRLKQSFIYCSESKALMRNIFDEMGCDLEKTYFDVPKIRSSTGGNYSTTTKANHGACARSSDLPRCSSRRHCFSFCCTDALKPS